LVVPFFGDQYFWGTKLHDMGVGLPYITVKEMTVSKLSDALLKLATDKGMAAKAKAIGEQIRAQVRLP